MNKKSLWSMLFIAIIVITLIRRVLADELLDRPWYDQWYAYAGDLETYPSSNIPASIWRYMRLAIDWQNKVTKRSNNLLKLACGNNERCYAKH